MIPRLLIFDDFFMTPNEVLLHLLKGKFADHVSPSDGVRYPGIQNAPGLCNVMHAYLTKVLGRKEARINNCFARLTSSAEAEAPNKIHSDYGMGEYAAHVYLSTGWPADSGTSFWRHRESGSERRLGAEDADLLKDANDASKWERYSLCPGKFNRCLIHDATLWHCAEPVGGWGAGPEDGRLVLTTFFSLGHK